MTAITKIFSFLPFFKKKDPYLGTISGVYMPNVLQMLGVILFLRLGWITGHVGIAPMLFIITACSSILLITGFSMTSIVTNLKMGSGGCYYLISRSLGIEFGTALGILLCCSQMVSIALCVSGFVSSLKELAPMISPSYLEIGTLLVLSVLSYISTNLAIRVQIGIFIALTVSLISVFSGGSANIPAEITPLPVGESLSFWMAFAMFYPATTGIEAGMSLSGDLKNPSRSLPIGTILAIFTAYILYAALAIFLNNHASRELLQSHELIAYYLAKSGPLVILGIWAATLSSALGGILGTPRTIQAIANDGMLPKFLGKGHGPTNLPRVATGLVFILTAILTITTEINQLIPILTMVCLAFYGLINFVCFFESIIQNPSWRPTFKTPWYISLLGSIACFLCMLMINPGATLIVLSLFVVLHFWAGKKRVEGNWDDIRYSMFSSLARFAMNKLSILDNNPKAWRPNMLSIVDPLLTNKNMVFFAHSLNQNKGFLTFGTTAFSHDISAVKKKFSKFFSTHKIPSFRRVTASHDPFYGIESLTRNYGMGPLQPNTIILAQDENNLTAQNHPTLLLSGFTQDKNMIILKTDHLDSPSFTFPTYRKMPPKKIHLWWGGKYQDNFELSLALAYLLQNSKIWAKAKIQINAIIQDESAKEEIKEAFAKYEELLRLNNLSFEAIISSSPLYDKMVEISKESDLTFLGLKPPHKGQQNLEEYAEYYKTLLENTKKIPNIAYVLAGEKIDFQKIFQ